MEKIGKKIYKLVKFGICSWKPDTSSTYEIVEVKSGKDFNDWCDHYTIKNEAGEEDVREVECIFVPDYTKQYIEDAISKYLSDNGLWAEVYTLNQGLVIAVDISWGDWRHSHLWCRNLMEYIGYTEIGNKITEEDGSDCYSAEHYYIKSGLGEE